jgi:hypothetical protein
LKTRSQIVLDSLKMQIRQPDLLICLFQVLKLHATEGGNVVLNGRLDQRAKTKLEVDGNSLQSYMLQAKTKRRSL